jgi:hypothetical protein
LRATDCIFDRRVDLLLNRAFLRPAGSHISPA